MRIVSDYRYQEEGKFSSAGSAGYVVETKARVSPHTILVIDDDPALQRLIQQSLAPGAKVIQEFSGDSDYVETLDFEGVDAVILDYQMPGTDGLDILTKIRASYPALPVLFMTGFGDLEIARQAIARGANEYFAKPFDPRDLRKVMAKWIPEFNSTGERIDLSLATEPESLANVEEMENFLIARSPEGSEISARVLRFNARAVVVEANLDSGLVRGLALEETCVTLANRSMEIAGAVVLEVTELADKSVAEIGLPGVWRIEGFDEEIIPREVSEIVRTREKPSIPTYFRFDQGVLERKVIPERYRNAVSDVEYLLEEFYDDLEPFEKFLSEVGVEDRPSIEERMIRYAEERFFPTLTEAMNRFERVAGEAERDGIREEFRRFTQKRLFPLIMCSPFLSRVIAKPIGVPGDFGILGRLLGDPYEGHSLRGRMLNAWAITANPSSAYRHRIDLLGKAINETAEKAGENGSGAKILSMASGVAYEVQRFVKNPLPGSRVDFDLVDFSSRTLHEARKQFSECRKLSNPEGIDVTLRQGSVVELAKQTKRAMAEEETGQYDLVYCAGLFDYLSQRMCENVVSYLYRLTKRGGSVIVSNYTPKNSLRYFMGVVLDWELIHRTPEEFTGLMQRTEARDNFEIVEDDTGTELYAIARKG